MLTFVSFLLKQVISRETLSADEYYEAVADFHPDKGYVCDGNWHNIRANYEKGSITLRVDGRSPIFALAEPESPHSRINGGEVNGRFGGETSLLSSGSASTVGTIYIGGIDGKSKIKLE